MYKYYQRNGQFVVIRAQIPQFVLKFRANQVGQPNAQITLKCFFYFQETRCATICAKENVCAYSMQKIAGDKEKEIINLI